MKRYLTEVLIYISVMTNNVEHLFICFFVHFYIFFGEKSLPTFKLDCLFIGELQEVFFLIFIPQVSYQVHDLQIFPPIL